MLNNKTNSAISHIKTKASTDPDLWAKLEALAFGPSTPRNTPNSSCEVNGSHAKFYISSSSSSSSEIDSNENISIIRRRYTL